MLNLYVSSRCRGGFHFMELTCTFYVNALNGPSPQITALCVIPMTWQYWVLVVSLIVGGGIIFFILAHIGEKLLAKNLLRDQQFKDQRQLTGYDNRVAISMTE